MPRSMQAHALMFALQSILLIHRLQGLFRGRERREAGASRPGLLARARAGVEHRPRRAARRAAGSPAICGRADTSCALRCWLSRNPRPRRHLPPPLPPPPPPPSSIRKRSSAAFARTGGLPRCPPSSFPLKRFRLLRLHSVRNL
jgi:hypothetical protein